MRMFLLEDDMNMNTTLIMQANAIMKKARKITTVMTIASASILFMTVYRLSWVARTTERSICALSSIQSLNQLGGVEFSM